MADYIFKIEEMFHLAGGQTALAGTMKGDVPYYVRQCTCRLIVNGSLRQVLTIDGEDRFSRSAPSNKRGITISNSEKISLDKDEVHKKECCLIVPQNTSDE